MNRHDSGEITHLTFERLASVVGLLHAVSARTGGVSCEPFDSLNLGFHVGDAADAVLENRRRFADAVGFALDEVVAAGQVHGTRVRVVGRVDRGRGAEEAADESWSCDALVTGDRDVFLMGFSADCPLVMLVDPEAGVAALAHAGWRPAFAGILPKTLDEMTKLGATPRRTLAAISPAIGPCCYEVGAELKNSLPTDRREEYESFFRPHGGKFMLDLPGLCRGMLVHAGVLVQNIETSRTCTRCSGELFYSHRRSGGRTGRHAAVLGWSGR